MRKGGTILLVIVGILDVIAGLAALVFHPLVIARGWLSFMGLYRGLEGQGVINQARLAEYCGTLGIEPHEFRDHLIDPLLRDTGQWHRLLGTALLLSGAIIIGVQWSAWRARKSYAERHPAPPAEGEA